MAKEEKRTEEPKAKPATAAEAASVTAAKAEAPATPAAPATAAEALAEGEVVKKVVKAKHSKNVVQGIAHVMATFNNTIVSITDHGGKVIG